MYGQIKLNKCNAELAYVCMYLYFCVLLYHHSALYIYIYTRIYTAMFIITHKLLIKKIIERRLENVKIAFIFILYLYAFQYVSLCVPQLFC